MKISKKLRLTLIILCVGLAILMGVFSYRSWKYPGVITEKVPMYAYEHKAEIDYQVLLNRNPIYEENSLGKGLMYLTPYIKSINANLKYDFKGERETDYKGDYEVVASMQGIQKLPDLVKVIWTKGYKLLPKTSFQGKNKNVTITKELPINIKTYNDFIAKFIKDTRIDTEVVMTVYWSVNVEADTDSGPIKEQLISTMTIPLNQKYFEIGGNLIKNKKAALEKTVERIKPVNRVLVNVLGIFAGVFLLAAAFLQFFTKGLDVIDHKAAYLKKIFKNHGERLVALTNGVAVEQGQMVQIKSLDDLMKVADELGKPVMYREDSEREKLLTFYVFDDPKVYGYELLLPPTEPKTPRRWKKNAPSKENDEVKCDTENI